MILNVKVTPGASKSEVINFVDGRLRIKIAAAPEDGKANAALIAFLAKKLGCAKSNITLISGEKSRIKSLEIPDSDAQKIFLICSNKNKIKG
jgi:uncharacterized protein (TIGR00251 family)